MSYLIPGRVYHGQTSSSYGYGYGTKSHRYLIEIDGDKVKYLQLDGGGSRQGEVFSMKTKSWTTWCHLEVEIKPEWENMIMDHGSTSQTLGASPGKIAVRTKGVMPSVVLAQDLEPGQTVLYGESRFLVIDLTPGTEEPDLGLVDLDNFTVMQPNANVPYFLAKASLTLTI